MMDNTALCFISSISDNSVLEVQGTDVQEMEDRVDNKFDLTDWPFAQDVLKARPRTYGFCIVEWDNPETKNKDTEEEIDFDERKRDYNVCSLTEKEWEILKSGQSITG